MNHKRHTIITKIWPSCVGALLFSQTLLAAEPAVSPDIDQQFRSSKPAAGAIRPFKQPDIITAKLPSGVSVYLVQRSKLPTVSLTLNWDGGSAHDPAEQKLRSSICMDLLDEGTLNKDKIAFEEAQADLGIGISSASSSESKTLSLSSLSADLDPAFALFAELLLSPGYRDIDLQRLQQNAFEGLKQSRASAENVSSRLGSMIINGKQHPLGRVVMEDDIKAVNSELCKSFHTTNLKPDGAKLFVVGDVSLERLQELFAKHLAKWDGKAPTISPLPQPSPLPGKVFFVDIPSSAQSSISFQGLTLSRQDPNYLPTMIGAQVLGGGFAGRVNMNLREDKGYAYGAYGQLRFTRNHGFIYVASSVRADASWQALLELESEIRNLHNGKDPVKDFELEREINAAILGFPANFATSAQAVNMYANLVHYGLPLDYYSHYLQDLTKLKTDQVQKMVSTQWNPDEMRIFIVGDAKTPLIQRKNGKDEPYKKSGKQLTLIDALKSQYKNDLVLLDADGQTLMTN